MIEGIDNRAVIQPYIKNGKIDYEELKKYDKLDELVTYIENSDPEEMNKDEQLAFWLNAYNIITLKSVLNKLKKNPDWEGVTSLWQKFLFFIWEKHNIGQQKMSLYHLENKIIRKKYNEPRIHFAINCASISCPFLPNQLFDAETLDEYLHQLTLDFINEQDGVKIKDNTIYLSQIFKMYTDDFGGQDNLISYVNKYWNKGKIDEKLQIKFMDYNWKLNSQ